MLFEVVAYESLRWTVGNGLAPAGTKHLVSFGFNAKIVPMSRPARFSLIPGESSTQ